MKRSARSMCNGLGLTLILAGLFAAQAATARERGVWQQLATAPYVLPGASIQTNHTSRFFVIDATSTTRWHIPAPGGLALRVDDKRPLSQLLEVHFSNGSGLLIPAQFSHDPQTGLWTLTNAPYGHAVIHARALGQPVQAEAFYLSPGEERLSAVQELQPSNAEQQVLRRNRLELGQRHAALPAGTAVTYDVQDHQLIRLRMRLPFTGLPRTWQDFRLHLDADGQTLQAPSMRAFQDRARTWLVDGTTTLLSLPEDYVIELPRGTRQLSITSTYPTYMRVQAVTDNSYLFPGWNRTATAQGEDTSEDVAVRLMQRQQRWQDALQDAQNNLIAGAPLTTAQRLSAARHDSHQQAMASSIVSRHTELLDLLPADEMPRIGTADRFAARYMEYRAPRLLHPDESQAYRWLGSSQLTAAANRAPGAWFVHLRAGAALRFPAQSIDAVSRLRIVAERSGAGTALSLSTDSGLIQPLRLAPDSATPMRHDPAQTGAWSRGMERLTHDNVAYAEVPVPAQTEEFTLKNQGQADVWVALQLRTPSKYRLNESTWSWLLMRDSNTAGDDPEVQANRTLSQLWRQAWRAGHVPGQGWQAHMARGSLTSADWQTVNGWLPTLHYLGEQHTQFASHDVIDVPNLHCTTDHASTAGLRRARNWERTGQWLNAAQAWREALPQLRADACVEAHVSLTNVMLQLGEHQLAERYQQTLVTRSNSAMLQNAARQWLLGYYQREEIHYAAVRLTAFTALHSFRSEHLRALVHALFDAGNDRAGLDVALAVPELRSDARVWATLAKIGWNGLLAQLRSHAPNAQLQREAFAKLESVRHSALQNLQFSNSVMVTDHLFDEHQAQLSVLPSAPLTFSVTGPMLLRLSMRPYLAAEQVAQVNDWALVAVNGKQLPSPLSMRTGIARYQTNTCGYCMGALTQLDIPLGEGKHQIEVISEAWPVAVQLHKRTQWSQDLQESLRLDDTRTSLLQEPASRERLPVIPTPVLEPLPVTHALPDNIDQETELLRRVPRNAEQQRQLMRTLTYLAQPGHAMHDAFAQRAEWLAHRGALDRRTVSMRQRLRQLTSWQALQVTRASAGIYLQEHERFTPESEYWRLRNLFLPPWQSGQTLLDSGQQLDMAFELPAAAALRIDAQHIQVAGRAQATAELDILHHARSQRLILTADRPRDTRVLELEPGLHALQISNRSATQEGAAKVTLSQWVDDAWQQITRTQRRRYWLASPAQQLDSGLRGPAWVRVDQLQDGATLSNYQYLQAGETLPAMSASDPGGTAYRILTREQLSQPQQEDDVLHSLLTTPSATPWPAFNESISPDAPPADPWRRESGTLQLNRHDAPTYSISQAWHADDDAREDARFPVDDFFETAISRRHRNATGRRFDEANLILRQRAQSTSAGASYYQWWAPEDRPVTLRGDARVFAQKVDGDWHWSGQARLSLRHTLVANPTRYHTSQINLFARHLSADQGSTAFDPDVFTRYRRDHRNGLEINHTLYWHRYLDAQWYGGLSVRSNELSQASVDFFRTHWGTRTQLGAVQLGAELQWSHYLRDDDRRSALSVPRLKLRARWYGQPARFGRAEVRAELRYDFDIQRSSGVLQFIWHFDRDQVLQDFHGERHWLDQLLQRRLDREHGI